LTPHVKEFDRLFGMHTSESERRKTAITKAAMYNCIVVLKAHQTFITDGTSSFENATGNAGLAKGGSGDALTGIIAAFWPKVMNQLMLQFLGYTFMDWRPILP